MLRRFWHYLIGTKNVIARCQMGKLEAYLRRHFFHELRKGGRPIDVAIRLLEPLEGKIIAQSNEPFPSGGSLRKIEIVHS